MSFCIHFLESRHHSLIKKKIRSFWKIRARTWVWMWKFEKFEVQSVLLKPSQRIKRLQLSVFVSCKKVLVQFFRCSWVRLSVSKRFEKFKVQSCSLLLLIGIFIYGVNWPNWIVIHVYGTWVMLNHGFWNQITLFIFNL